MKPTVSPTILALPKVNLFFKIASVDDEGMHLVRTVMAPLRTSDFVHDEVRVVAEETESEGGSEWQFKLVMTGDQDKVSELPTDDSNLALKAVKMLFEAVCADTERVKCVGKTAGEVDGGTAGGQNLRPHKLTVFVNKQIPIKAGLAGGSADAGAALVAGREVLEKVIPEIQIPNELLFKLARKLGADVSFCLHNSLLNFEGGYTLEERKGFGSGICVGTHFGEELQALKSTVEVRADAVTYSDGLSTPAVFREFDKLDSEAVDETETETKLQQMVQLLESESSEDLGQQMLLLLENDLERAATKLKPELSELLAEHCDEFTHWMVTGSGPTVVKYNSNSFARQ